jgi:predicted short-subunit dehydrogenase-like oxidoreductase (DUF2520 family)
MPEAQVEGSSSGYERSFALPSRIAVIGSGRAGRSIARAASGAGLEVELAGREGALAASELSEIALLCVPDGAISDACDRISPAVPPLRFVGHISGATSLEALCAAADRGAELFSIHPLQTLPDGEAELDGAACAVSGSSATGLALAAALASRLGMRPFELPEAMRPAYHAAASIASNFLVTLEEAASELLARAGVEEPREALAPLVLRTAANWSQRGHGALTGPIARGDAATIERHLDALAEHYPELLDAYRVLAARTAELARAADRAEVPA